MIRTLSLFLLVAIALPATAQPGGFGIGGQIGEPTGLTIKVATPATALDFAAEWDFDNYFFAQGHVILSERNFPRSEVGYFWGPGGFLGTRTNADTAFGLSFNAGVNYYTGPVEFFGQVTPRLRLTPDSDFDLGAAFGIRFYP